MKFVLISFALLAIASVANSSSVASGIKEITDIIPVEKIEQIIRDCNTDPELVKIGQYLRSNDFRNLVEIIRTNKEVVAFFKKLNAAGVEFTLLNSILKYLGLDPIIFTMMNIEPVAANCGGWRGVYDRISTLVSARDIIRKIDEVYGKNKDFAAVWDEIGTAEPLAKLL